MVNSSDIKKIKKLCGTVKTLEVAAPSGRGIEKLKEQIYSSLEFISIFMKPQGEKADLELTADDWEEIEEYEYAFV